MIQIVKKPAAFNFAGNISDIVVRTDAPVSFLLYVFNGGQLLDESYVPMNGEVTICLRDLMERVAVVAPMESAGLELPLYMWSVGNLPVESFRCVRGGHQAPTDSAVFARSNFLTWQPQTRRVNFHTPLRLSYAALGACTAKVKGYFKDGRTKEIVLRTLAPDTLHTFDVGYGPVAGLLGEYPTYYDVWVEGAGIQSYLQRYMYSSPLDNADEFMWVNSLGGIDTAIFTGDLKRELKYESFAALFDRTESEIEIDAKRVYTKFTGYLPSKNEQLWVLDFFYSTTKYHNDAGALRRIVVSSPKTQSTRGELSGYEFSFAHSVQSPYLNLPRLEVPELLEVEDPQGEVFFLAPRLALFDVAEVGAPDVLIPVQYSSSSRWLQLPLADILRLIVSGGSGGGTLQKHAMSHAQGGSDPIGPYSIGAAKRGGDKDQNFAARHIEAYKVSSPGAVEGILTGKGMLIGVRADGTSYAEFDEVSIRKNLRALKMTIQEVEVEGGIKMQGSAILQVERVVDLDALDPADPLYKANTYRLYFDTKGGKVSNQFKVGDQARCHRVNADSELEVAYYWRVVNGKGKDYIDLYKNNINTFEKPDADDEGATLTVNREVDTGSSAPKAGDVVCGCGSISDPRRMAYKVVQTIGEHAPIEESWSYVNDFRPSRRFNATKDENAERGVYQADYFVWRKRDGGTVPALLPPEVWTNGLVANYPEQYTHNGSTWLCMGTDVRSTPSGANSDWLLVASKGSDGTPGAGGTDGKTSYVHIKYSNDGGVSFTANNGETPGSWIGQYTDFTATDSNLVSAYTWSKIQGEKGSSTRNYVLNSLMQKGGQNRYIFYDLSTECHNKVMTVTLSFDITAANAGSTAGVAWAKNNDRISGYFIDSAFAVGKRSVTIQKPAEATQICIWFNNYGRVGNLMLAEGTEIAPWQEAPEDVAMAWGGDRNYLRGARYDNTSCWRLGYLVSYGVVTDARFGSVVRAERVSGSGEFQTAHELDRAALQGPGIVTFSVIAKPLTSDAYFDFGGWMQTYFELNSNRKRIALGDGWYQYYHTFYLDGLIGSSFGLNSVQGTWLFYGASVTKGTRVPDIVSAPEDIKLPLGQGVFVAGRAYSNNNSRQDVVKYGSAWYKYIGIDGEVQGSWNAANWEPFGGSFESVATGMLFAENASIQNGQANELQIQDDGGNVVGGISGRGSLGSSMRLWFGGTKAQADDLVSGRSSPVKTAITRDGRLYTESAIVGGSLRLPQKVLNLYEGNSITLNDEFNYVLQSAYDNPITVYLPADKEYNGTLCIFSAGPVSRSSGIVTVKQSDGSIVCKIGGYQPSGQYDTYRVAMIIKTPYWGWRLIGGEWAGY